jgi:hypothetical protein
MQDTDTPKAGVTLSSREVSISDDPSTMDILETPQWDSVTESDEDNGTIVPDI